MAINVDVCPQFYPDDDDNQSIREVQHDSSTPMRVRQTEATYSTMGNTPVRLRR